MKARTAALFLIDLRGAVEDQTSGEGVACDTLEEEGKLLYGCQCLTRDKKGPWVSLREPGARCVSQQKTGMGTHEMFAQNAGLNLMVETDHLDE